LLNAHGIFDTAIQAFFGLQIEKIRAVERAKIEKTM
jgi:hypothetical protein